MLKNVGIVALNTEQQVAFGDSSNMKTKSWIYIVVTIRVILNYMICVELTSVQSTNLKSMPPSKRSLFMLMLNKLASSKMQKCYCTY